MGHFRVMCVVIWRYECVGIGLDMWNFLYLTCQNRCDVKRELLYYVRLSLCRWFLVIK